MRTFLRVVVAALAMPHAVVAQDWISLGGMGFEMDTNSIGSRGDAAYVWIRKVAAVPEGQMITHILVVAHCGQELIEIERGIMEADWSPNPVEMPDLPPQDRFMALPVPNPAFNNMYSYLCSP